MNRTDEQTAKIHSLADLMDELANKEDTVVSPLNMMLWDDNLLEKIAEEDGNTPRADIILDSEDSAVCIAGYAVALHSPIETIRTILNLRNPEKDNLIANEAQRILGLSEEQAKELYYPGQQANSLPIIGTACETESFWPGRGAQGLRMLARSNTIDWNEVFIEEQIATAWHDAELSRLPSDVFRWEHMTDCKTGCDPEQDGICLIEAIRRGFDIRDESEIRIAIEDEYDNPRDYAIKEMLAHVAHTLPNQSAWADNMPDELERIAYGNDQLIRDAKDPKSAALQMLEEAERYCYFSE